ncbi:MAG: PAS domain S-box protein [Cyanobacteria bacterium CRU_2_1]|nr:PAS domain S-box protein [Cyanobacteria bacterium RU_5_0]NJR58787.1 PAS domain S-box protein [Cyanobacteria bacterium CRU_2_1]
MISTFWDIPGIRSKKSLEFLARLLDPICVYDDQGEVIYASQAFLELLQAEAEEVSFYDYFLSESTPQSVVTTFWNRALQGETVQFLFNLKNTREAIECSLQFSSDAKLMFLLAKKSNQDTCIHKIKAEYERLFMSVFNHPSLAIALIHPDGTLARCNQRLHELLGTDREINHLEDFVHPEDKLIDVNLRQKLLDGDIESYTIEKRFIAKNGEVVWVNASVSLLNTSCANGHQSFAILLEDITENKKIYSALIRTEGKWKTFVLNSSNLFIQTTNSGQIIYASPAVERTLGYETDELLDLYISELIHPHDLNEIDLALYLWSSGIRLNKPGIECRWRSRSGKWVYLYIQGQRFPLALEIDGVAICGYNISERKRLEAELRASEEKFRSLVLNSSG